MEIRHDERLKLIDSELELEVGVATYRTLDDHIYIDWIEVDDPGKGHGGSLVEEIKNIAKERNMKYVKAETDERGVNVPYESLEKFWKKHGYEEGPGSYDGFVSFIWENPDYSTSD